MTPAGVLRHCALVAVGMLALAGCTRAPEQETEIQFWAFGSEGENVKTLLPGFERSHPGLRVKLQVIPWTAAHEKLLTAYAGESTPDICQLGNTWIPEFVTLKAIEPLAPWIQRSGIDSTSYFPGIWRTNFIDGVQYGLPWYVDTRVLYYRKDIFAQVGFANPPKTWAEWDTLCNRIVKTGGKRTRYAILLPTTEWAPPVILGMQKGSEMLRDRNCYGDFSGDAFISAFRFYIDFFSKQYAPAAITDVMNIYQSFGEGYFAMYISGPWNIGEFSRRIPAELQDTWMTAPLPGPDPGTPGVSLAGGSSLVLFSNSRHKEASWELIRYLSDPERQITFYRETGDLPARVEAWQDSALANNVYARAFFEQLKHVAPTPTIPQWEQIAMKVQDYAELAARGKMTVNESMKALDKDVDRILEKRRWMLNVR
jgi:multiple sugar transport system substrate-binding protein